MNKNTFKIVGVLIALALSSSTKAQKVIPTKVNYYQNDSCFKVRFVKIKTQNRYEHYCNKLINKAYNKGYISASIDSSNSGFLKQEIIFQRGHKFFLGQTQVINNNKAVLNKFSYHLNPKPYSLTKFKQSQQSIINHYQNSGYPFPSINIKTQINKANIISHTLEIEPGTIYTYGKLFCPSIEDSENTYLQNVTKIRPDKRYKKSTVKQITNAINNTLIYKVDSIQLNYNKDKLNVIPFLQKTKNNSAEALIGIQSNSNTKTVFTGYANLNLLNVLKVGEAINFTWNKANEQSQLINCKIKFPFIGKIPVGAIAELNINKIDSNINNNFFKLGFNLNLNYKSNIETYYSKVNNNTNATIDTIAKQSTTQTLYGISFLFNNNNFTVHKQNGFSAAVDINGGKRSNETNNESFIFQNKTDIVSYFKVLNSGIKIRNQFGFIANDSVGRNELFLLGGVNSMKGFNEQSIYCKRYLINSLEYQIFMTNKSYFSLIYDFGTFYDNALEYKHAIGTGLTLWTKGGTLSIWYTLGKTSPESFNVKNAKIHMSYIAVF